MIQRHAGGEDGGGGGGGGVGRASDFAAFVQPSVRRLISELIQYNAADANSVAASRFGVLLMPGLWKPIRL